MDVILLSSNHKELLIGKFLSSHML